MRRLSLLKRGTTFHAKFDIPAGVAPDGTPAFRQIMRSTGTGDRTEATKKADLIRRAMFRRT